MNKNTLLKKTGLRVWEFSKKDALEFLQDQLIDIEDQINGYKEDRKILIEELKEKGFTLLEIKNLPEFIEDEEGLRKLKMKPKYIKDFIKNINKYNKYFATYDD